MTNREWLLNKMQNMSDEEFIKRVEIIENYCNAVKCVGRDCDDCLKAWLNAEHKEQIKLSDAERVILENIDKVYNWIARDKNGRLFIYTEKPSKAIECWTNNSKIMVGANFNLFIHLFQFIKWEDEQAYSIEELLKGE